MFTISYEQHLHLFFHCAIQSISQQSKTIHLMHYEALYLYCLDRVALLLSNNIRLVSGKLS